MQAPPLVTAARLVALSQVIWGKWATQCRCRDTIETVQSIGYKGYEHLKLRVCNFSSRVFKSLNIEKQPLLEEKKREEGGLPSFPFPLLVCLLISSCSILSHSLVFSGLLQQQAAPAVGPAHSYSCQGPSCHTTESWIKNLSFVWYCSPPWTLPCGSSLFDMTHFYLLHRIFSIYHRLFDPVLPYEAQTYLHSRLQKRPQSSF